ncbi:MAG TPA: TlpA disulfide reductase family protein [Kofleriaceae bacterium]|jgi:thiol-disulfide isomerase/thioredoxin|nr:TlpA disulfide reductase family protein [Kofleriaceae bacterium]
MSTKALIGILLAGTAGIVIFLFVHLSGDSSKVSIGSKEAQAGCTKGGEDCLPDVGYVDTNGAAYTHESLHGKVVIINFWATWCGPCKKELPELSKLYKKYKDQGVVMLGVLTSDTPSDGDLLNFQSDYEMEFPVVRSSSDIMLSYNYPQALPTTFVFDRHGRRVGSPHVGAIRADELDAQLAQLVAQH